MGFCRERGEENDNGKVMWVNNSSYSPMGSIWYLVAALYIVMLGIQTWIYMLNWKIQKPVRLKQMTD